MFFFLPRQPCRSPPSLSSSLSPVHLLVSELTGMLWRTDERGEGKSARRVRKSLRKSRRSAESLQYQISTSVCCFLILCPFILAGCTRLKYDSTLSLIRAATLSGRSGMPSSGETATRWLLREEEEEGQGSGGVERGFKAFCFQRSGNTWLRVWVATIASVLKRHLSVLLRVCE